MFSSRVKCNYANVDIPELLNYAARPPDLSSSPTADVFREGVFKKSGHHKGVGKTSITDQVRCFRLKNHFLFYYQGDSMPIVDKNVTGVIVLVNVYITRGLMSSPSEYPYVLRISVDQVNKPKVYELRCQDKRQRDDWFQALQSVVLNHPAGGCMPPITLSSVFKLAHMEANCQGQRSVCSKLKGGAVPTMCDSLFLSLSFQEMHTHFLAEARHALHYSQAVEQWQIFTSGEKKEVTEHQEENKEEEKEVQKYSSLMVRSTEECVAAFKKHQKFLSNINQSVL